MQSAHCRQPVGPEAVTNSRGMWLFLPTGRASAQWSGLWAMAEPYCFSQGKLSVSSTDGTVMMSRIHTYLINFSKHETAWLFTGLWTVNCIFILQDSQWWRLLFSVSFLSHGAPPWSSSIPGYSVCTCCHGFQQSLPAVHSIPFPHSSHFQVPRSWSYC